MLDLGTSTWSSRWNMYFLNSIWNFKWLDHFYSSMLKELCSQPFKVNCDFFFKPCCISRWLDCLRRDTKLYHALTLLPNARMPPPYVVALLKLGAYIWVVYGKACSKSRTVTKKTPCVTTRLDYVCARNLDTFLRSIMHITIGRRTYVITSRYYKILCFRLYYNCWRDNLCDPQLLTGKRRNSWARSKAQKCLWSWKCPQ